MIDVERTSDADPYTFQVTVTKGSGSSEHEVSLSEQLYDQLADGAEPERFIEACFEFLLDREPKESILSSFDVSVISRYFPEFEDEIGAYL